MQDFVGQARTEVLMQQMLWASGVSDAVPCHATAPHVPAQQLTALLVTRILTPRQSPSSSASVCNRCLSSSACSRWACSQPPSSVQLQPISCAVTTPLTHRDGINRWSYQPTQATTRTQWHGFPRSMSTATRLSARRASSNEDWGTRRVEVPER